ncbi:NAD(P)-binding protein [Amylocystis lapponica]|nr:NAD(P)-binding protein [Amylocystis lapponica]
MSIPANVQAITISKQGDFGVIEKTEIPLPKPGPGEAVVKVHYGGVNFIDTYYRQGLYPLTRIPWTIGTESSGTVVSLPTDADTLNDDEFKLRKFAVGQKVSAYQLGAFAEYIIVPWKKVFPIPESVPFVTAAAALTQGATAITFMTESYNVQQGDIVLVHTVAGGLGLLLLQYAKHRGATVIGTTSTPEKAALARAHGVDHVIIYPVEDTVQRVLEITNGEGVHAVFDGVGKDTFDNNFKVLRRKGTLVSIGNASGAVPPFPPLKLVEKNLKLLRPTMGNYLVTAEEGRRYIGELYDLVDRGVLKINVYKEYPFSAEGAQQAQKDLTGGKTTGKLVVKIAD